MRTETHIHTQGIAVEDVRMAIQDSDPEKRAHATMRLAQAVKSPALSDEDRLYANKVLKVISEDVSDLVRRALAVTLKNSRFIPKIVVAQLITDIESIAVPLITHSPILDEEDLALILRSGVAGKVRAVAARADLSNSIIMSLIDNGDNLAARTVVANDRIALSEAAATAMVKAFREDDVIRTAMMNRAAMPMAVVEKLVAASADDIADRLYAETDLSRPQTQTIGSETHQRTIVSLPNAHFRENTLRDLVSAMKANGRLSPEIVIRAMGVGKIGLVHYALANLAGLSVRKVVLMLHDTGPFALRSICDRAGLDEAQTAFMQSAIRVYTDLEATGDKLTPAEFQQRMLERVLTLPLSVSDKDEAYFLGILDGLDHELG